MRRYRTVAASIAWARLTTALLLALALTAPWSALAAMAQDNDCLNCHKALANVKDGHASLKAGCKACHVGTDASTVPHKTIGKLAGGLSAAPPQLCVGCHDKPKYRETNAHTGPAKSCTECHTVHVSKNEKLLKSDVPELCYSCHDEKAFRGKFRHKPVIQGVCLDCHDAHSAQHRAMLILAPELVCLECHSDIKDQPHVAAGFSRRGHPLGDEKSATVVMDPLQPGKRFYCGSCHQPHRAEFPKLNRFDASSMKDFCQRCHEK